MFEMMLKGEAMESARNLYFTRIQGRLQTAAPNALWYFRFVCGRNLQRAPRGAHEISQHSNVWAVRANSPRIHGKSQPLGEFQVHASVVQFRKAESLRRQHTIQPRRIHRPWWAAMPPWAARHLVKLFPIAFVPGRHSISQCASAQAIGCRLRQEGSPVVLVSAGFPQPAPLHELLIYISGSSAKHFPRLLYQTRYGEICFGRAFLKVGWESPVQGIGMPLRLPVLNQNRRMELLQLAEAKRFQSAFAQACCSGFF
jgi:hypothetical protein